MPFINLNGQLTEVTQEQYDIYTIGQNVNSGTPTSPQTTPAQPASGGEVVATPTTTSTILTPNTTNNTPGQELPTSYETVSTNTTAPPDISTTTIQNLVNAALAKDTPVPVIDTGTIQQLVRDNIAQNTPTPVPGLENINLQQLVNDALAKDAPTSIPAIDTGTIQQLVRDNIAQTDANTTVSGDAENYYQQMLAAVKAAAEAPTPSDSPYAPVAAVGDTPLVTVNNTTVEATGTVTVEQAPAEFDNAEPIPIPAEDTNYTVGEITDQPAETNAGPASLTADELNAIADAQGVAGEEGNITTDTFNGQLSAAELDAIAAAQGVAGEEGNITADTLARDPGSYSAAELDAIAAAQGLDAGDVAEGGITDQQLFDNEAATSAQAAKERAQNQQTRAQQQGLQSTNDWRVKLTLAKNADYLYNSNNPGILKPLADKGGTGGVIFPYTPQINTNYRADYSAYNLTHSNYKGYFYNSSYMDAINMTATFTAQDTKEAEYLLAVIHFFRSVTKMFYGQDTQRGSPPPLVYLSGLGEYQFNRHPCVVSQFTYTLPADVDYIRATSIVNQGISFNSTRNIQSTPVSGLAGVSRLANALLPKGAKASPPAQQSLSQGNPTYVPTKMEIVLTLLPVQSRNQVSKVFKLSEYAAGNQLKGGFW